MLMCIQSVVKFCPLILMILSKNQILKSIKSRYSVVNCFTIPMLILSMLMCIQILVKFCPFHSQDMEQNKILTCIKGRNSQYRSCQLYCVYKIWSQSVYPFSRYEAKTKFGCQSRAVTLVQICSKRRIIIPT